MGRWWWIGVVLMGCVAPPPYLPSLCEAPVDNGWPAFEALPQVLAEDIGYGEGQVPPDVRTVDQFGQDTCLWQFAGHYVLVEASALWAEAVPRDDRNCDARAFGDGFVHATFITEGATTGVPATQEDLVLWSTHFELDRELATPVLLDADRIFTDPFPGDGLPSMLLLGPDLRVILSGEGKLSLEAIRGHMAAQLGVTPPVCE